MPYLRIETNQDLAPCAQQELLAAASRQVAELLGKPERYVMVALASGVPMRFAASDAPLVYMELKSIGLARSRAAEYSAALCAGIGAILDVPADRIYIEFAAAEGGMWGWNGGTF